MTQEEDANSWFGCCCGLCWDWYQKLLLHIWTRRFPDFSDLSSTSLDFVRVLVLQTKPRSQNISTETKTNNGQTSNPLLLKTTQIMSMRWTHHMWRSAQGQSHFIIMPWIDLYFGRSFSFFVLSHLLVKLIFWAFWFAIAINHVIIMLFIVVIWCIIHIIIDCL